MKKGLLLLLLNFCVGFLQAQEKASWQLKLNDKIILQADTENEPTNTATIKNNCWKKNNKLSIQYTEPLPEEWFRSFIFMGEDGQEIFRVDSTSSFAINLKELKKKINGAKEVKIYLGGSPSDPNIQVRMRLVHLCTIRMKK